jgi:hypothetical protein
MSEEDCKRHRVELRNGDNFYFMMGENFIQCCPPNENRPENLKTRMLLDDFCDAITKVMGGSNE